jgi:sugar (pentulose or hexulose) kinase
VTLSEALSAVAEELADVSGSAQSAGGVLWDRSGRAFAASSADGQSAEFRLDPAVADAALRTPDTTRSRRGPDWVRFSPVALDDHALDRAEAWFGSAWRRAERP